MCIRDRFTRSKAAERRIIENVSYGGGCVNDTIVHLANDRLPFGGVGASGMGSYHGKASFDTFTHYKGVLKKSNLLDIPLRYACLLYTSLWRGAGAEPLELPVPALSRAGGGGAGRGQLRDDQAGQRRPGHGGGDRF